MSILLWRRCFTLTCHLTPSSRPYVNLSSSSNTTASKMETATTSWTRLSNNSRVSKTAIKIKVRRASSWWRSIWATIQSKTRISHSRISLVDTPHRVGTLVEEPILQPSVRVIKAASCLTWLKTWDSMPGRECPTIRMWQKTSLGLATPTSCWRVGSKMWPREL